MSGQLSSTRPRGRLRTGSVEFKKRLNKNRHRGLILARGGKYWVYAYLFAKKDRANIEEDELAAFRELAVLYAQKRDQDLEKELACGELEEICDDDKGQVQE